MNNDTLTITREQAYGGQVPPIPIGWEDAGLTWMENGKMYEAWLTPTGEIGRGVFDMSPKPRILLRRKAEPRRWMVEECNDLAVRDCNYLSTMDKKQSGFVSLPIFERRIKFDFV